MENNIFLNRRSVFPAQFKAATIDDTIIRSVLEDANNAPSHKNTEPWRFKVYSGDARKILSDVLGKAYKKHIPKEKFSALKHKKLMQKPILSSHVIAISMQRHIDSGLPEWEELAAVACAVQNIYLSCTMRGLGCYWSSPKFLCENPEILSLPEGQKCLGLVYIGIPKEDLTFNVVKGSVEEKTIWVNKN